MALEYKLYYTNKFKILKNLRDLGNCVATNKLCGQPPNECYIYVYISILCRSWCHIQQDWIYLPNDFPPKEKGLSRKDKPKGQDNYRTTTMTHWKVFVIVTHHPFDFFFFLMYRMTHLSCNKYCNKPFSLMIPSIQNKEYPPSKTHTFSFPTPVLLRYNWHTALYKFKVYNIMILLIQVMRPITAPPCGP